MNGMVLEGSAIAIVLIYGSKTIYELVRQRRNGSQVEPAEPQCPQEMVQAVRSLADTMRTMSELQRSQTEILRQIASGQQELSERTAVLLAIHDRGER